MLSEAQVALVQASFLKVVPRADPMARCFYARLFELRPDLRPLFAEDMTEQRGKLVSTLAAVVQGLSAIDTVFSAAQDLGRRHVQYNVKTEHYGPVGEAMIFALRTTIEEDWDAETEQAWAQAYAVLSKVMIDAAAEGAAA